MFKAEPTASIPATVARAGYDAAVALHVGEVTPLLDYLRQRISESGPKSVAERLSRMHDIAASGLFDEDFYLRRNPDVKSVGTNPLEHYVDHGEEEGRDPNAYFSAAHYRALNEVPSGESPLAHYVREGEKARRPASAWFDAAHYLAANPLLGDFVDRPLFHFLRIGRAAGLPIRPLGEKASRPRKGRAPRIAAILGVLDEAELLAPAIRHLRAIGVDHIMACDMGSTDGSAAVLKRHASDDFTVFTPGAGDGNWHHQSLVHHLDVPADWIIFLDVDEFWIPASGNLKDCAALRTADALLVDRFNVVASPQGPLMPDQAGAKHLDELMLIAERVANPDGNARADFRGYLHGNGMPWICGYDGPKVMVRRQGHVGLASGHHDVLGDPAAVRRVVPNDLLIAHVPFSTFARFERKVANATAYLETLGVDVDDPAQGWEQNSIAWHWRRWAALAKQGRLREEFDHNVFDARLVAELASAGVVRSAAELLRHGVPGRAARQA